MNQYRYRLVNQHPAVSFLPSDITSSEIEDNSFDALHLGIGAMMPNDLSSQILCEMSPAINPPIVNLLTFKNE